MKITPLFLLPLALLAGCAKSVPVAATALKPVLVRAAPVIYSTDAVPVRLSGVLARRTEAELSFKIGGIIEELAVRAGDTVTQGQMLARLQTDEIDAQVTQARSAVEKTRRDLARTEKLQAGAVATLENLQDARTGVEQAEAQLRIAEFNRRHAVIVAPATGRVLRRLAEPNELVASGRAVLEFAADADGWLARAGVAEREAGRIRLGDAVDIALPGASAARCTGRITQISEATDALTRTTPIEIALDAPPAEVRSGFVVAVTIHPQPVAARPVVPASALIEGAADAASLYVIEAGSGVARRVAVRVEALLGNDAYLATPLSRTGQVVLVGAEFLRDGAAVELAAAAKTTAVNSLVSVAAP
jgi:RND family efflux transporter MFP subunit